MSCPFELSLARSGYRRTTLFYGGRLPHNIFHSRKEEEELHCFNILSKASIAPLQRSLQQRESKIEQGHIKVICRLHIPIAATFAHLSLELAPKFETNLGVQTKIFGLF